MSSQAPTMRPGLSAITPARRTYTLFMLVVVYASSQIDRQVMGILLEPIKRDLMLSDTQMGFMSGFAFAIFYATLGVPVAWLADRSNRRNIIAIAIALWSGMTALCGLSQNFTQLALARIGVGIGEAGSSPPSHSMISDLYPAEKRAGAMGIFALGVYIGVMIAFIGGGVLSDLYGWRVVFFTFGLPGLVVALLVRFTLVEPKRGAADGTAPPAPAPEINAIAAGFRHLWRSRASRHLTLGCTLVSFIGYGGVIWVPPFLARSHDLSQSEIGLILGLMVGIGGGAGALTGGWLADRWGGRDPRWGAWIVALSQIVSAPFVLIFYLADSTLIAFISYAPIIFLGAFYLGPTFGMIQSLAPPHRRAMAAAILLLILNLIGLGLGPQMVGILSDLFEPYAGSDSVRYALLAVSVVGLWATAHYYLAGAHYAREIARDRAGAPSR